MCLLAPHTFPLSGPLPRKQALPRIREPEQSNPGVAHDSSFSPHLPPTMNSPLPQSRQPSSCQSSDHSFLSGLSFPCKEDTNGESSQPRPSHRGPALPPRGVSKGWWKSGWWALSWHRAQAEGSGSWPACPKPFPEAFGICKQQ